MGPFIIQWEENKSDGFEVHVSRISRMNVVDYNDLSLYCIIRWHFGMPDMRMPQSLWIHLKLFGAVPHSQRQRVSHPLLMAFIVRLLCCKQQATIRSQSTISVKIQTVAQTHTQCFHTSNLSYQQWQVIEIVLHKNRLLCSATKSSEAR